MNTVPGRVHSSEFRMYPHSTKIFNLVVLVIAVTACQAQVTPPSTVTPPGHELTITVLVQTITAQASTPTSTPFTSMTDTPSSTPTVTETPTPTAPQVGVSSETNCRTGPTRHYKLIWEAEVGRTFEVVGRYSPSDYWIIRLDDGRECWLWGQYATVEGDISSLTEYIPPAVGRLEGEVRHSGAPDADKIADAFVDIGLGFEVYRTGKDGKFVFEDVPMGEVRIIVVHHTYVFNNPLVYIGTGQLRFAVVSRIIPASLTPIPTRRCPNCQPLPTFAPPLP